MAQHDIYLPINLFRNRHFHICDASSGKKEIKKFPNHRRCSFIEKTLLKDKTLLKAYNNIHTQVFTEL